MSTRGLIAMENPDRTCRSIYVHVDMYPNGGGVCLAAHYKTKERVEALLALGDLSGLGDRLSKDDSEPDAEDTCCAYHRDCGEEMSPAHFWTDADTLLNSAWDRYGVIYVYLFRNGEWYVSPAYHPQPWKAVTEVLEEKDNGKN